MNHKKELCEAQKINTTRKVCQFHLDRNLMVKYFYFLFSFSVDLNLMKCVLC